MIEAVPEDDPVQAQDAIYAEGREQGTPGTTAC
jgi:hypothetical protein